VHRSRWLSALGFVIVPMASIASPLLAIPAITSQFGVAGWTAVAVGQSLGASFAVIVELGWSLTGPQRVARQGKTARERSLAVAILTKVIVLLPLAAIAGAFSFLLSADFRWESAAVAVGATTFGLNNMWYYIGTNSASKILITDAMPRVVCVSVAAIAIFAGGPLLLYPLVAVLLPSAISTVLVVIMERLGKSHLAGMTVARLLLVIKFQGTALGGRALSAIYISLPVTLVTLVSPASVPVFSAIERLQRIYMQVLTAVPNMMQNWVGRSTNNKQTLRLARQAICYNALFGLGAGLAFTLALPLLTKIVFADTISVPTELGAVSGFLIAVVCTSRASGSIALVALRRVKTVMLSALAGSAVGIPAILIGATLFGAGGALLGEVFAEIVVLGVQLAAVKRADRWGTDGRP
jgi:O-antigen/teichoic acid export membrane protein